MFHTFETKGNIFGAVCLVASVEVQRSCWGFHTRLFWLSWFRRCFCFCRRLFPLCCPCSSRFCKLLFWFVLFNILFSLFVLALTGFSRRWWWSWSWSWWWWCSILVPLAIRRGYGVNSAMRLGRFGAAGLRLGPNFWGPTSTLPTQWSHKTPKISTSIFQLKVPRTSFTLKGSMLQGWFQDPAAALINASTPTKPHTCSTDVYRSHKTLPQKGSRLQQKAPRFPREAPQIPATASKFQV